MLTLCQLSEALVYLDNFGSEKSTFCTHPAHFKTKLSWISDEAPGRLLHFLFFIFF